MSMIPADEYSDIMELAEFVEAVALGVFVADDGMGYYGTENFYDDSTNVWLAPTSFKAAKKYTHVHWFNQ